jgi:hypothetical protein
MIRRWLGVLVAVVFVCGAPASSWAQRGLSLEVAGGGTLVPGAITRDNLTTATAAGGAGGEAIVFDERANPSASISLRVGLGDLEVAYRGDLMGVGDSVIRCRGDRAPEELPNGTLDDSAVRYDCGIARDVVPRIESDGSSMLVHSLSGGMRWSSRRGEELFPGMELEEGAEPSRTSFFGVVEGGLAATTYAWQVQDKRLRFGAVVGGRGGIEIDVNQSISLAIAGTYRLFALGAAVRAAESAGRTVDRGGSVGSSLFDLVHVFGLELGLRLRFR